MVLEDEVQGTAELPVPYLLMIDQADVARFIGVNCFDNHVRGFGSDGIIITKYPSGTCLHVIEGNEVSLQKKIDCFFEVCRPNIDA